MNQVLFNTSIFTITSCDSRKLYVSWIEDSSIDGLTVSELKARLRGFVGRGLSASVGRATTRAMIVSTPAMTVRMYRAGHTTSEVEHFFRPE
ncbi:hypothetical protein MRB53_039783 [Persea americana]|nr:hypothetical protein MRB53_039783 [Persea americana]